MYMHELREKKSLKTLFVYSLTTLLNKVDHNVEIEPRLISVDNEQFDLRSADTSREATL